MKICCFSKFAFTLQWNISISTEIQKTHDKILQLKNKGLGYRSISKELNRLGYKSSMGKDFYPSLVSVIWKKIEKKQRILNKPVVKEYSDFDIVLVKLKNY